MVHMSSSPVRILVVDDEASFRDALTSSLSREGFVVETAADGREALDLFAAAVPDVVLLDVMLPGISGIDVCRAIRDESSVPIIMVSAKAEEIDTVIALEVGADDYVAKPYRFRELVARIRSVLRRKGFDSPATNDTEELVVGDLVLRRDEHEILLRGEAVSLPLKEFEVLALLMENAGHVVQRHTLLDQVWGYDYVGAGKTLDVHVKRIRSKIEDDPKNPTRLITIRGLGYKLSA